MQDLKFLNTRDRKAFLERLEQMYGYSFSRTTT